MVSALSASTAQVVSLPQPSSRSITAVGSGKESEFFTLNATYRVAEDAKSSQLMNDALCWIDAAKAIVNEVAAGLTDKGSDLQGNPAQAGKMLWGAFHLLEMVDGAVNASFSQERAVE